jgi:hypothetical protein
MWERTRAWAYAYESDITGYRPDSRGYVIICQYGVSLDEMAEAEMRGHTESARRHRRDAQHTLEDGERIVPSLRLRVRRWDGKEHRDP